jgi:hypothetical protein
MVLMASDFSNHSSLWESSTSRGNVAGTAGRCGETSGKGNPHLHESMSSNSKHRLLDAISQDSTRLNSLGK